MTDGLIVVGELASSVSARSDSSSCGEDCDLSMSSLLQLGGILVVHFHRSWGRNDLNVAIEHGRLAYM